MVPDLSNVRSGAHEQLPVDAFKNGRSANALKAFTVVMANGEARKHKVAHALATLKADVVHPKFAVVRDYARGYYTTVVESARDADVKDRYVGDAQNLHRVIGVEVDEAYPAHHVAVATPDEHS
jgi:hypothetical protein